MSTQAFCLVSSNYTRSLNAALASAALCLASSLTHAETDTGMLRIATSPAGAQIFINGQHKGNSPVVKGQEFAGRMPQIDMVSIPAGSFAMGSTRRDDERPVHKVRMSAFEMGKTEVTFDQWDACFANDGCDHFPKDEGWGRGNRPVINVSWDDAQQFITWLNQSTGKRYRLPSEAEWEYAARAGSGTRFSVGGCLSTSQANYDGKHPLDGCRQGDYREQTTAVGSFAANAFGLHDMHGNVWEWTQDCWNDSHSGAPSDGTARTSGNCSRRVIRGGSWYNGAVYARSGRRNYSSPAYRDSAQGFRLAMAKPTQ